MGSGSASDSRNYVNQSPLSLTCGGNPRETSGASASKKPIEQPQNGCPKRLRGFPVSREGQNTNEGHEDKAQPHDAEQRINCVLCHLLNCLSNTEARTVGLRSNFRLQFSSAIGPTTADFAQRTRDNFSLHGAS